MGAGEKRLFLLDGMALAYRGYFALVRNPRMTTTGMNTSMVFVFATTLLDIIHNQKPTHIAVAFDTDVPTKRHEMYEDYKAQREAMPEDIRQGLPYVDRLCEGFCLPVIRMDGFEADDVIGTVARQAEAEGFTTYMVTPDKDFAQLVTEKVLLYRPGRSGSGPEILGVAEVLDQWGIEDVGQVIDVLGLMGDTSDNVPGVPGIGPKTAQKLVNQFGSVEGLLDHLDQLKGKQKENLEANRELALLSKELVTIDTEVPLDVDLDDLVLKPVDEEKLRPLFAELEFSALGKRVFGERFEAPAQQSLALGEKQQGAGGREQGAEAEAAVEAAAFRTLADVAHDYRMVDSPKERADLIAALRKKKAFCLDTETSSRDPKRASLVGLAISYEAHTGFYVPLPEERGEAARILEEFRPVFEDPEIGLIGHNTKFDLTALLWHGFRWGGPIFDTMLAAHLATPDLRLGLDSLAQSLLGYRPKPITDLIGEKGDGQKSMRDVPVADVAEYAAEDADITLQLWHVLEPKIGEAGQRKVFDEVEAPLVPVLVDMEHAGIRVDVAVLEEISDALESEIARTEARIFELAGEPFNLNSPKQLGEVFFERLELDANARRTSKSKQYQTNERVLTRLANRHEIAAQVLHYRESTKLKSTYLDMLPGAVHEKTGHIHTNYEQAVAVTGRMQSSNPNLQNIPVRSDQGREIRKAFVPRGADYVLFSADYSQIELRIVAHLSGDRAMKEAFERGDDIHAITSMRIYGVDEKGVTAEMRRRSKTVNFGIIYGISAFGLADRLDIARAEASDLIKAYFAQYPGIRVYMDHNIAFCRQNGYVETITGRRRYLRDINSRNATIRSAAERNAINSPVQGSAADMIKIAMWKIHQAMRGAGLRSQMLLQVHDELVFDMYRDEAGVLPGLVEREMKTAIPLSVPVVVETGVGENWLDAH